VVVLLVALVVVNLTVARLPEMPPADGKFISLHGMEIHYFEQPGQGVPVVMIHGQPGSHEDFDPVVGELPGLHLISIDRPGFGWSKGGGCPIRSRSTWSTSYCLRSSSLRRFSSGTRSAARWPSVLRGDTRRTSPA